MPIQSGAQLSARPSAARALSGVLFCCDRCAAMMCFRRDVSSAASRSADASLCRCPRRLGDPLLQRPRIVAAGQHVEIVIALEHQRVAAAQARFDVARRHADVGQHAEPMLTVADDELHRLARIVRHGKRPHFERADRERVVAVEAVDRGPSARSARRPFRACRT